MDTSARQELKDRVEAKKHELESRLSQLKADTRGESRDEQNRLQTKLEELNQTLKRGWDNVSETAADKLNRWLRD